MSKIFIGMKPWGEKGDRIIESIIGTQYHYDLRNNCRIKAITLEKNNDLVFEFIGRGYLPSDIESLGSPQSFKIIFHGTEDLKSEPTDFVPKINAELIMDDFLYTPNSQGHAHITWFGDSDDETEDPKLDFLAQSIEFEVV